MLPSKIRDFFLLGGGRRERAKLKRMFIVELHEAFQFKLFAFIFTRSFKQRFRNRWITAITRVKKFETEMKGNVLNSNKINLFRYDF